MLKKQPPAWTNALLRRRLWPPYARRYASTAASAEPEDIRNIALMAHIDSGKTTLTESILHASSYLLAPGSVDTGSTTTDFLPAERERGITIQSASIPVKWGRWTFNLIDTPGHADFGMEVESASRVVDGAVVLLDAVEGVEGQTKGVWRQLDRHSVPTRMIFINKLDRPGASLHNSILSILNHRLHPNPVLLTLPVASFDAQRYRGGEPGVEGIVDLVNWEMWRWHPSGESTFAAAERVERTLLPTTEEELRSSPLFAPGHPLVPHLVAARAGLIDNISVLSSELMDEFVSLPEQPSPYLSLPPETLLTALRQLTLSRDILPIFCGAALKHIGTDILLDFVGHLLASPSDVLAKESGKEIAAVRDMALQRTDQMQMLAWKVSWDKRKGWMTFVRVYSGTLRGQSTIVNTTNSQRERVSKVMLLYAAQHEEVDSLSFGSVGVVLGLKHTRTGDTLTSINWGDSSHSTLSPIVPPPSVISASVVPQSQSDVQPVQDALAELSRTDPSLRVTEDEQEGQVLVHGLGALHLEIVEGRLKDEWGVKMQFGKRRVSYRENLGEHSEDGIAISSRWEKDLGGKHIGASVDLVVRALRDEDVNDDPKRQMRETWGGNVVVIKDKKNRPLVLPSPESSAFNHAQYPATNPITNVLQGILSALSTSPQTFLPLSHLHVNVVSFDIDQGSPPTSLVAAASQAMREALEEAGPGEVMEPYIRLEIDVGDETVGKVVKDLTEHGGEITDLGSGMTMNDDDIGPYSSDGIYLPPPMITPSSMSLNGSEATASIKRSIHAVAPLARMLDYSSRLRAVSGGQATFEMASDGFRAVGETRRQEILREIGRA